jgi:hypothetical protein
MMATEWYEWVFAIGAGSFGIFIAIIGLIPPKKPHIELVPEPEEPEERHLRVVK